MSYGRFAVDWEDRINFERMRKERVEKVRAEMKELGLEAILVLRGENQRYIAQNTDNPRNYPPSGLRYAFLAKDGLPVLFEHGMWYPYVKKNCPWLEVKIAAALGGSGGGSASEFIPEPALNRELKRFAEQIKKEMEVHGIKHEILGIDSYNLMIIKALESVGIKVSLDGSKALIKARTIKTKDEIECLRIAASIVEAGWLKVKEALKPGVTELELKGVFVGEIARLGGQDFGTGNVYSGARAWCNNIITSDKIIRPGDLVVFLGCNVGWMGYRTCYYRTFACGRPKREEEDTFIQVRDYLYDAIKIIKPGVTTRKLAEKWPKAEEFGYPDEVTAYWIQWGHGIGLSLSEPPSITRAWSLEFPEEIKAGMTIALETWLPTPPTLTHPHGQSVRLEEMVVVTETGYELLTQWPIDELTVCNF
ncbi:MAG: Xaa-Pro peptidase family protein [Candidatus Bathyarchaeia archaeon]